MKKYDVLAAGGVYMDINATGIPFGEAGLGIESETVTGEYDMLPGGSALNFNRICHNLGLSTVIVGKVGDDGLGHSLQEMIAREGITPALVVEPNKSTNIGINLVNASALSVMLGLGTANQALTADDVLEIAGPLLPEVEYLYLSSCLKMKKLLPSYEKLAGRAAATDMKIVIDHGRHNPLTTESDQELVRKLVVKAAYYFPSRYEFMDLWGVGSIESGLKGRDWGKTVVMVKDGGNGAYGLIDGELVHEEAHDVTPKYMTGAGDSFNAGVISAIQSGKSPREAIAYGCATAALKISSPGMPQKADIEALVNTKKPH